MVNLQFASAIAFAVLICNLAGCPQSPSPSGPSSVSTAELIELYRSEPNLPASYEDELCARIRDRRLNQEELAKLIALITRGDQQVKPGTKSWEAKYIDAFFEYCRAYPTNPELDHEFASMPFVINVEFPALSSERGNVTWPSSKRSWACIRIDEFGSWRGFKYPLIRARAAVDNSPWVVRSSRGCVYVPIPPLPPGETTVTFEVQIGDYGESGEFVSKVGQKAMGTIATRDVVAPDSVESEAIKMLVAQRQWISLNPAFTDDGKPDGIEVTLDPEGIRSSDLLRDVQLSLVFEVIHGDEQVATLFFVGDNCERIGLSHDTIDDGLWQIVIRGDWWIPGRSMPNGDDAAPTQYWRGEIQRPIDRKGEPANEN